MTGCHVHPEQMFNLIFGYNDRWLEDLSHTATGTTGTKDSTAVPADEVWVLQGASLADYTRAGLNVIPSVRNSAGADIPLGRGSALAQYVPYAVTGSWVLKEGDYVRLTYSGTQNNDSMKGGVLGYKMVLTQ